MILSQIKNCNLFYNLYTMGPWENPKIIEIKKDKDWNYTQKSLKENLLPLKNEAEKFLKNDTVLFYSYDDLPEKYKEKLWSVDNSNYNEEYFKNSLIVYQTKKDWTEDLYPISKETFKKTYKIVESDKEWIEWIKPKYTAIKKIPVNMLKAKDYLDKKWKIEAPWGGTQDFDENSYIVLWDWEVYICQMDEQTWLPIWYIKENTPEATTENTKEKINTII